MNTFLNNPVFICGHRKAGTTMLINLFDNTKGAITYPDDSGFFYKYFPRYASHKYSDEEKIKRLHETLIKDKLTEVIANIDCDTVSRNDLYKKQKIFSNYIKNYDKKGFTYKDILIHFMDSFKKSFYESSEASIWIEKTTTTEVYALELSKVFPNAKFIHIIRDPRDNWGSLLSGWDKKYNNYNDSKERLLQSLIDRGRLGMELAKSNASLIGKDRYKVIKFEDLTKNPEYWMSDLAEFAGIPVDKSLFTPTTFGFTWGGNNFDGIKMAKPTSVNVSKWKSRITEHDAKVIEFHFHDIMRFFDYNPYYSKEESQLSASEHYKWYNFSTMFSDK